MGKTARQRLKRSIRRWQKREIAKKFVIYDTFIWTISIAGSGVRLARDECSELINCHPDPSKRKHFKTPNTTDWVLARITGRQKFDKNEVWNGN